MDLRERLATIRARVAEAARRAGRDPGGVELLAATKTQPAARVREAIEAGITLIGENRLQEALEKFPQLPPVRRHFIGHLQTNKAKAVAEHFDAVESLDRWKLARALDRAAGQLGKRLPVLIEVNVAGEASKSGAPTGEALALARRVAACEHLVVQGLMGMPPYTEEGEANRPHFETLAALYNELAGLPGVEARTLSMGTSQDFEVAVEAGATLVRLGTALFGPRN